MTDIQTAIEFARQNRERFLDELKTFVSMPSVSTSDEHKADVARTAEWVAEQLRSLGMSRVAVMPTGGHPAVYGEWLGAGKKAPTVLIYGHYDVQPVDPLDLWKSDPFEGVLRGEYFFGRGVSDMKGQVLASMKAVESAMSAGKLPVNVKWLIEGEEEVGSKNLGPFIQKHSDLLKADVCLNPDAGMMSADLPTITYGLRGLCYLELRVYGPAKDLHSGLYGGTIHNPAQALTELVAGMHDKNGRITLPGFYDKVRKLTKQERAAFASLPVKDRELLKQTGVKALWGEPAFIPAERVGARPTLEVNGLLSGWTGKGSKTVLPAYAMAKISCRLVPDQTPEDVVRQMKAYLRKNAPKTVRWELDELTHSGWAITDLNSRGVQAMSRALETVWGKKTLFRREGGSIGVVVHLQQYAGVESVLTGFGLPDDDIHSPNERLHLPTWHKGIEALVHFIYNMKV
ncbi:MAG: Succinyl-diaminopimelate desuccinylase [Anaerolineales bacterium]|nr:Succinyl-diaminopimelate desuccinylase [Anaerolineales bacterium]